MAKLCLKKKSKRIPAARRYKIEKRVRDHNRKKRKEDKKKPKGKKKKMIHVPNDCPFKDEILKDAEAARQRKEEEKKEMKAMLQKQREEKEKNEKPIDLFTYVKNIEKASKESESAGGLDVEKSQMDKKDGSLKAYYKEFKKVVEAADVVLEVVDARDPLGTRCKQVEQAVLDAGSSKRLVIIVNKADLVPRAVLEAWLKYLRSSFPAVPFKASTQEQGRNLGRKKGKKGFLKTGDRKGLDQTAAARDSAVCVGADLLMSLLANYCRNKGIKTAIRVGVVGLPNVGKSSIINSLKRSRACNVGATPGVTKQMQEVALDSKILLLDSPGLVFANSKTKTKEENALVTLRNAMKVESLADPFTPAQAILQRATKKQMMELYDIAEYHSPEEFFALKARRQGKLKKRGLLDLEAAARGLIDDWNRGKIRYYTIPPEDPIGDVSSAIVSEMSEEFSLDKYLPMETEAVASLPQASGPIAFLKSSGIVDAMDTDVESILPSNVAVNTADLQRKKLKRKADDEDKWHVDSGIPLPGKKIQKLVQKKARKEKGRRERETTQLAGDLENFSLNSKEEDYDFNTDFSIS